MDDGTAAGPVDDGAAAEPAVMVWADGERDRWLARAAALDPGVHEPAWSTTGGGTYPVPAQMLWAIARGPDEVARDVIARTRLRGLRQRVDLGRVVIARFGIDALDHAVTEAEGSPDQLGMLLLPFRAPRIAPLAAGWLRHLGSARLWARLWLRRHPETAVRALLPAATGKPGRVRQQAEDALHFLTTAGHGEIDIVAGYARGGPAGIDSGVRALFAVPPGFAVPPQATHTARKGGDPAWTCPEGLPEIRLTDGGALPEDEVAALIAGLREARLEDPPEPAPGDPEPAGSEQPLVVEAPAAAQPMVRAPEPEVEKLIARCDRASLAAFGRALLDEWLTADMPAAQAWVLLAQAHVGDDTTMDRLAPLVRGWPPKSRYLRAIDGHAVLATMGTDVSLRHLLAIEENMSGGAMNERATVYLTQAAARRGLSVTQLADRLAVTHGLDTGIPMDYGTRAFTVTVDEKLSPQVVAADGRVLARPPKPGAKDTRPEAYQWFLQFKKELRATVAGHVARLRKDMTRHRFRPARDLPAVVLPHPLLGPLARRLLWGEYDAANRLVRALRIAEDGSFADLDDSTATVDGDTPIGIPHPAELGADLADWRQIFVDYEILQPFPQVHRPAVSLTGSQRAATGLPGWGPVAPERILELVREQWTGNAEYSAAPHTRITRDLPGGHTLVVDFAPGVPATGNPVAAGPQRIVEIWADHRWSDHLQRARRTPMGVCDPAALSEALVELYPGVIV
ncbi:hypothetical protein MB27_10125 [Actinoplanes utahensis]|uniref:DUF4132 domain-containing protein n=1 Tax=Actinoplanes utahensis TaxID=1869 RepID=A0A0A6XBJ7_ACTUT|nr:hypothetical protein MB27_10125 [Actinoplanes utahensis]